MNERGFPVVGKQSDTQRQLIHLFVRVLITILVMETAVMFLLPLLLPTGISKWVEATSDAFLLTIFCTPVLWILVLRPLHKLAAREKHRAEAIVNTAVDPIITISTDGLIKTFNPASERLFGYSAAEVLEKNIKILMPSPYHEEHDGYLERYQATERQGSVSVVREAIAQRKNGTTFPIHLSVGQVEKTDQQEEILFTGILRDLTSQKQQEEELRQSEKRFRTMFDESPLGIALIDSHTGHIDEVNTQFAAIAGRTRQEMVAIDWMSITHPDDVQEDIDNMTKLNEGKISGFNMEKRYRRPDDSYVWIDMTIAPFSVTGESSPRHLCMIKDITEQKRSEEQFLKLSAAVEQSPIAVMITDSFGVIEYVNARFIEITGYSEAETIGQNPRMLNSGETPRETFSQMWNTLGKGEVWQGEFRNKKKNGEQYWESATIAPITNSLGKTTHFVALKEDVTGHKQMEMDLVEQTAYAQAMAIEAEVANETKSEFLANMSHEIRTPMTAILGFTDLLLGNVVNPENVDSAKTIKRNGEYLINLINDILDLSKIESGKIETEQIDYSTQEVIADAASLMRVRATAKGLPLTVRFDGPIPETICTDPTRLRQIVINIVGNAIKFTESGSVQIVIRLLNETENEPKLQINVIDTGIGISEDKIEKLFQPFTQADSSTTRRFGGTGLGLSISKRMAELLGGEISVTSTTGKGSTFSITVSTGPLGNVRMIHDAVGLISETAIVNTADNTEVPLSNCRILLAEDGPDNQRLIGFILKKAGAEVTLADNGQIALDLAIAATQEKCPFDVILMDMQMPVLDGYEATGKLREEGYTRPIIALTAHAMATDRQKCLDAGCDDYATKPIDRKNLIEVVASYAKQVEVMEVASTID